MMSLFTFKSLFLVILGFCSFISYTSESANLLAADMPNKTTYVSSGPIVLKSGDVIENLHITNPDGPCIQGTGVSNIIIQNNFVGPCGANSEGNGVYLKDASYIRVINNKMDDVATGMYVVNGGSKIVFSGNYVTRARGPYPRGQMIQFNNVQGSGLKITCNVSDQTSPTYTANGKYSGVEDHINIYNSKGRSDDKIEIAYNKLRGGGPSPNGGGIMTADSGKEYSGDMVGYVHAHHNILVDPGQYGISVSTGQGIQIDNNVIYSPNAHPWSNVGMFVWNQYKTSCDDISLNNNQIFYISKDGSYHGFWNGQNHENPLGGPLCTNVVISANQIESEDVHLNFPDNLFETEFGECQ
jgi:hypothetical protein